MHPRFKHAVAQLPDVLRPLLVPRLSDPHFSGMFSASEVKALETASGFDETALALALLPVAAACARAPISHFQVGAIAHGVSGNLWLGANMEFPGSTLQQTIHAEQSAISHAWTCGERRLRAVTVNYTPCGHCRQFMNELNSGVGLIIQLPERQPAPLSAYLPEAFGPEDLGVQTRLMDSEPHVFMLQGDALSQAAIAAASRSHAPYSHSPSGVALEMKDGTLFSGSYAESAAYNPSLPPLQVALNVMYLNGYTEQALGRVLVAERADAALTQWDASIALLRSLGCHNADRLLLESSPR
ncbi:cytidine deaminase [Erwinia sp. HR93]|uniref:cytidine deaminase n=1 Tax=Erwinia sp. HR93 TaxID=3094840 RepID=UPI002ADEA89A|nr:cytidine deaminase [Erwinia sp. HR93]MEA1065474.1 cytidine deaminase [Erwinia sp. HR93]